MNKYKATIEWHEDATPLIKASEYVEYRAKNFRDALKVAEAHLITFPNARLVRLETI